MAMLGKIVKKGSSGTLYGAFSLVGSVGVLFINKLGGYLYSEVSPIWPFIIVLISNILLILMTSLLALFQRLKV